MAKKNGNGFYLEPVQHEGVKQLSVPLKESLMGKLDDYCLYLHRDKREVVNLIVERWIANDEMFNQARFLQGKK